MADANTMERHEFKTEVQKLLNIISQSLYTNREIFLRELVSNASDALDKLRFEQSRDASGVADPDLPLEITITTDKDAKTLAVTDTGIGMTRDEAMENIGTIARSGSQAFMERLAEEASKEAQKDAADKDASNIIGRFGVGFYSVFMVATEVTVKTRSFKPGEPGVLWRSDGGGQYEIRELTDEDGFTGRGTRVEIALKDDAEEFADQDRLKAIIKKHSGFIAFPVKVGEETVNTTPALWREPKFQITPEQYHEFYTFLTYDTEAPLFTIHQSVDAPVQFSALLFAPKHGRDPFGFGKDEYGPDLYVRRVLISKQYKDLLPEYLGFLKGVVDTEDLPLNISRETLQENLVIRKISQALTKQVLNHLEKQAKDEPGEYEAFWRAHNKTFKLGYADFMNKDRFAPLLRFNSSIHDDADGLTSLDEYIGRAKPDQKAVYYVSGSSRAALSLNPHLEIFRDKGVEVLYLYEPLDEFVMDSVREYKEFALTSVEHADLEKLDLYESAPKEKKVEELADEDKAEFNKLLERIKEILGDKVTEVKASARLSDSPCCLVSPDGTMTSSMQKIMHIMSKDTQPPAKAMEVNPDHPLSRTLLKIYKADAQDPHLSDVVNQLYESSLLLEGYLSDPHAMVARINSLLEHSSGWYAETKKL